MCNNVTNSHWLSYSSISEIITSALYLVYLIVVYCLSIKWVTLLSGSLLTILKNTRSHLPKYYFWFSGPQYVLRSLWRGGPSINFHKTSQKNGKLQSSRVTWLNLNQIQVSLQTMKVSSNVTQQQLYCHKNIDIWENTEAKGPFIF